MMTEQRAQSLLDAMDGVTLLLDRELRIVAVGWPNWQRFLRENGGPDYPRDQVLGRRIDDFITGDEVRETYRQAFKRVVEGDRSDLRVTYRCDAPDVERLMRLSVTRVALAGEVGVLYQSVLLSALQRPPIGLFGLPVKSAKEGDLLTVCSLCARVAWPKGARSGEAEWIDPPEYYRRGGEDVPALSHGFCPVCFDRLMKEID